MNGTNKREMAKEADKQDTQQGQLVIGMLWNRG